MSAVSDLLSALKLLCSQVKSQFQNYPKSKQLLFCCVCTLTFDEPSRRKWPKLFTNFSSRFSLAIFDLYIFFSFQFCPDQVKNCDRLRLSTICRMLQTPLFSSKMNALKEVSRLIEESEQNSSQTNFSGGKVRSNGVLNIGVDEVVEWMAVRTS